MKTLGEGCLLAFFQSFPQVTFFLVPTGKKMAKIGSFGEVKRTSTFKDSNPLTTGARRQHRGEQLGFCALFVGPPGQLAGHFVKRDAGLED